MKKTIHIPAELKTEAAYVLSHLVSGKRSATLVTLSGELGAGKTAFTKELARLLGVRESVTSPTFTLVKIYLLSDNPAFKRLVHIDAYRLTNGDDLAPLGFDEVMEDPSNLVVLEWPENVADALPVPSTSLRFFVNPDGSRTISYG